MINIHTGLPGLKMIPERYVLPINIEIIDETESMKTTQNPHPLRLTETVKGAG